MTRTGKLLTAAGIATVLGAAALTGAAVAHDRQGGDREWRHHGHHGQMMRGDGEGRHGMKGRHGHGDRDGWRRGGRHGDGMRGEGRRGGHMRQMLRMADENNDGTISAEEIAKARDGKFSQYDANSDGKLSLDEFQGLIVEMMRPRTVRMFQHLDPDGDAGISKDEFDNTVNMMVDRLDRNDDGSISRDDRRGRMGRHHMRRDGRGMGQTQDSETAAPEQNDSADSPSNDSSGTSN